MRKSSIAIGIAAAVSAPVFFTTGDARSTSHLRLTTSKPGHAAARFTTPTGAVLYDQSGSSDNGAPAQHDSNSSSYDAEGADDFVVTDANGWSVSQVNAQLAFQTSTGPSPPPPDTVYDVVFYADAAGAPGAAVSGCTYLGATGTLDGTNENVQIALAPACNLPAGSYWVSMTPNFHFPPQSFWSMSSSAAIDHPGVWRNPRGAFNTTCSDWTPLASCQGSGGPIGGGASNYLFQLVGAVNGGGTGCSGSGICLTVGLAIADPGDPNACGTATSLDVTAGDQVNFCYTVTNNSGHALDYQSLSDNINGPLLTLDNLPLAAGGTLTYHRVVTASATQTITSTWTSQDELPGYTSTSGDITPGVPCDRIFADGFDGVLPNCPDTGDFIQINTTGTPLNLGDDESAAATLPFSFNLYGQSSNQICVGNNGYILFATATCPTSGFVTNSTLPSTAFTTAAILPYWDDLYTGGNVFTQTIGAPPNRKFVVEWYVKNHYDTGASDPGGITFEVIFGEDGTLKFQYLFTEFDSDPTWDNGGSATIGLQKDQTLANQFSSDTAGAVHDLFYVDWAATNPSIFSDTDDGVSVNVGTPEIELAPTSLTGTAAQGSSTTTTLNVGNIGDRDLVWSLQEAAGAHLPPIGSRFVLPMGAVNPATANLKQRPGAREPRKPNAHGPMPFGGTPGFAADQANNDYVSLDVASPATLNHIGVTGGSVTSIWGGGFVSGQFTTEYLIGDVGLKKIDTASGAVTTVNGSTGGGDVWGGTIDPNTGAMYFVGPTTGQQLSRIDDLSTGTAVVVGPITGSAAGDIINAIAIDLDGHMWGIDKTQDALIAIDKTTGATSLIGSLGVDSEFIASLAFDYANDILYLASPDNATGANNIYTVDTTSGAATLIAPIGENVQLEALAIATTGVTGPCANPADVPWLSLAPISGTTPAAGSTPVTATLSAAALAPDTYHANVCVSSNDPVNRLIAVPVDFTVTTNVSNPPTLSKAFAPAAVDAGAPSTLTITLANTNTTAATLSAALTDTFPSGLVVAATPSAATTCGGTVTAVAGSGSVSLGASGAAIPANGSCAVTVKVQSATPASYANSIAAGALQTSAGSNAAAANATLTVNAVTPIFCSAPINHLIANNTNGTSVNWISGSIVDADPATGYDINIYGASTGLSMWWSDAPAINAGVAGTATSANYTVLTNGATIGPASTWSRTNGAMTAFRAGANGYLGFRFDCSSIGGTTCYGYTHLTTTGTTGFPATLVDYCYDRTGAAITIPGTPPPAAPTLAKAFAPTTILTGATSTATLTLANTNATAATLSAALSDALPSGLVVAATPNAATTCTSGSVTAAAGAGTFSLGSGAQIPANGSCTVSVDVTSAAAGSYTNTLAAGALQTDAGNNLAPASASLTVNAPPAPTLAKAFAPTTMAVGGTSTATLTLANANATAATLSAALSDALPSGLVVAATPNAATTCTSGTVNAAGGAGSFDLGSGAQIPANGSCTVSVDVTSATAGNYTNTLAAGALQTNLGNNAAAASASLTVNPAVLPSCPTQNFDGVTAPALPSDWLFTSAAGAGTFTTVSTVSDTAPNSAFAPDIGSANDMRLTTPSFAPLAGTGITFRNRWNLENTFDGAVVEISVNGGAFQDIVAAGGSFVSGGYNGAISANASGNPLLGRAAWTNTSGGAFVTTTIAFPPSAVGQPTQLRFRTGDDDSSTASGTSGWWIDTVTCSATPPTVSKAFAPTNTPVGTVSTLTISLAHPAAAATLTAALTDTLPTGLVVAATPNASTTCTGGAVTAAAGSGSVSLASGAVIPEAGCNVKVDVTAAVAGIYVNTIAAGALQTDVGNNAGAATANYQATQAGVVTYTTGFETPTFAVGNLAVQGGWGVSGTASDWQIVTANPHTGAQNLRATWASSGSGSTVAISPTSAQGTTDYSYASAFMSIAPTGAGTPFDFAPQDTGAGKVITRVRFNNDAAKNVQFLDPVTLTYVNTGATWTAGTYYAVKVVAKRSDSTMEICLNGTSIHTGPASAPSIRNVAFVGTKGSGTINNVLSADDVLVDNTNTGGCP